MNIKQRIASRWHSFRAWQEQPITYRRDEHKHVCHNCGHTFRGNYCPVCSQSARQGRVGWLTTWQGIAQLWGFESRSAVYTIWQLLLRPGYLVRDYISGKRQVSYPPVKLLFIMAAIVALAEYFFPRPAEAPVQTGIEYLNHALEWLDNHKNVSELLSCCVFILPTWLFFRKAPLYTHHTIPEGFYLQVYLAILSYIFYSILPGLKGLALALSLVYFYITYKQLFGYGYWGTFWRSLLCITFSFAFVIFITVVIIVSEVILR
ncbi:MAG: DUF3667 domain-containing protein [Paludibacteraceae bacterium]|nr:DUF3667 domain-containing protein [Paludibacteraceae bacterium]